MYISNAIRNHRNYDADDYAYLNAIGWTDAEILARWDAEAEAAMALVDGKQRRRVASWRRCCATSNRTAQPIRKIEGATH